MRLLAFSELTSSLPSQAAGGTSVGLNGSLIGSQTPLAKKT